MFSPTSKTVQEFPSWSIGSVADSCSKSERRTGRDGLLRLAFEREGPSTVLRRARFALPLQVLSPLTLPDGTSYLLLLNPTGGILGGDTLQTEINVGENAHVCISTPSATRVYRTSGSTSLQETKIRIAPGGCLEYLPDHLIPSAGASLRQSLRVEMEPGSRGIFLDAFASGRQALAERWNFRDLDLQTEIYLARKPLFLNRTKIIPGLDHCGVAGTMGDFSYIASLTILDTNFANWPSALAALRREVDALPDVLGGASLLMHGGLSLRYLTKSAIALTEANRRLWTTARREMYGLPPLDLRKY